MCALPRPFRSMNEHPALRFPSVCHGTATRKDTVADLPQASPRDWRETDRLKVTESDQSVQRRPPTATRAAVRIGAEETPASPEAQPTGPPEGSPRQGSWG